MSKTIKVSDEVYLRIQSLQGPRETYSEVILRCLSIVEAFRGMSDILGPAHYLMESPGGEKKD